jgi:MFS family permease
VSRLRLPSTVIALGFVSLATDLSSEMIVPLLPAFLAAMGAGGTLIGLIDGVAETTSAILKLLSGRWADRSPRKKPLVIAGYGIAGLARPLVGIAAAPWHVLVIRFVDRIGKGIRSSPRDALLSLSTPLDRRGAAFGFHRAMDHAGALLGPLVAFALLAAGLGHRAVFLCAAIPAALAVIVLVVWVREAPAPPPATDRVLEAGAPPAVFYRYLAAVAVFTLASSTDFFLLLRAAEVGIPVAAAPLVWAGLHAVKMLSAAPLGALSDRMPRKRVILLGWGLYAACYAGFAAAREPWHVVALVAIYGLHAGFVEGAEKALVADLVPPDRRGRGFGAFHFTVGCCALPASLGFGLIWDRIGHDEAFLVGAGLAAIATVFLALLRLSAPPSPPHGSA